MFRRRRDRDDDARGDAADSAGTELDSTGLEPTGLEPTGLEPTGLEPTGLEPTGPDSGELETSGPESGALDAAESEVTGLADESEVADSVDDGVPEDELPKPDRPDGPWDASEIDLEDEEIRRGRLDLGALVIKGRPAMQLRLDVDQQTGRVRSVTFITEGSGLQVQAFAAPRSSRLWPEVRTEIAADCARRGGRSAVIDGPYGKELQIVLPVTTPDGQAATQASRIVGIDGPRWLLRASFLGAAMDPDLGGDLAGVLRDIVVVRGTDPMAPRDMLPLRVPTGPDVGVATPVDGSADSAPAARPPLSPFRRGPEITELR